jgi:hypothetical protein
MSLFWMYIIKHFHTSWGSIQNDVNIQDGDHIFLAVINFYTSIFFQNNLLLIKITHDFFFKHFTQKFFDFFCNATAKCFTKFFKHLSGETVWAKRYRS